MPEVICPFCGNSVAVSSDGRMEPTCGGCGAWVVAARGRAALSDAVDRLASTMAVETREVSGPVGDLTFVATPYLPEPGPFA